MSIVVPKRTADVHFRTVLPDEKGVEFSRMLIFGCGYEQLYKSDGQVNALIKYFGTLAILISAMGLLSLAAFTTEQRTKEIGIRKVLGASVAGVVTLLSRYFMKLVLLAILIAFPLAWYVMNRWLGNYAYRIDIQWWVFALAGLLAIVIAILSVGFQSVKAALVNPVKSLGSE